MKNYSIFTLILLWLYFTIIVIVGNTLFFKQWSSICEVFEINNMCIILVLSWYARYKFSKADFKIFSWFVYSKVTLLVSAICYMIINYILKINDVNQKISLIYLIPSYIWIFFAFIYWFMIVKHNLKIKANWFICLTIILIDLCLVYMVSMLHLKPFSIMSTQFSIFLVFSSILFFLIFNLAMCVLICARSIGMKLLAAGTISLVGANFLTSYVMYTDSPSMVVFRNDFWFFSSTILISGLIFLITQPDDVQIGAFDKDRSIKSIFAGWTASIVVITISFFLALAHFFGVNNPRLMSLLPYTMFCYIIFAIFLSLVISYIFERSIHQLNITIQNFLDKPSNEKNQNKINIAELAILNDFLIYVIEVIAERNKIKDKINKLAAQVVHDIRSPLASLKMVVTTMHDIPEMERITLRSAVNNMEDIANQLLNKYEPKESLLSINETNAEPILLSASLLQILSQKKYQYKNTAVKFDYEFGDDSNFAFINIISSAFNRMISNLINNSVDAFKGGSGHVVLKLKVSDESATVIIEDNGKGMSQELINKIMNNEVITEGKDDGHGLGLTQVRETLQHSLGTLQINSTLGKGVQVVLTFPRVKQPNWVADTIYLNSDDTVIILDDDRSIHNAWAARFHSETPNVILKHFTFGQDAIDYIGHLSPDEKDKVFLLTDFELLKQEFNGLQIVEQVKITRSILVTSHYANFEVQQMANATKTKILPKELAFSVTIKVARPESLKQLDDKIQVVIVDDDIVFANVLAKFAFKHCNVDKYNNPEDFLKNLDKYDHDTKICLDNNYNNSIMKGTTVAKTLHEKGYTYLYIISGNEFDTLPEYLTSIRKDDIESFKAIAN